MSQGNDRGLYSGPDRRRTPDVSLSEIQQLVAAEVNARIEEHEKSEWRALEAKFAEIRTVFVSALPGGDVEQTRRLLEGLAQNLESIKELASLLNGLKFLRRTVIVLSAIAGSLIAAAMWAKDHISFK